MSLLDIHVLGSPVLREETAPVAAVTEEIRQLIRDMFDTMYAAKGIGLAAPQVGVSHRVLVYRVEPDSPVQALVNPEVEWTSRELETMEEGCLSLPGVHVDVERPLHVRVRARDASGERLLVEASGLEARVIQHEIDHLDGVLILDRTSRDQRKEAIRMLRDAERSAA